MTSGSTESVKPLRKALLRFVLVTLKCVPGFLLIALAAAISVIYISKASPGKLTDLENILFQVITMGIGLLGSFFVGTATAKESAKEIIKPHARSAFRRVLSLYASLGRLLEAISKSKQNLAGHPEAIAAIEKFESLVLEQIYTANDTIEDWGDLLPEETAEIKAKNAAQQTNQLNQ
jgi:uncharacterized membrane protein